MTNRMTRRMVHKTRDADYTGRVLTSDRGPAMPVTHVNRKRDTYYLHVGRSKAGKPRYWFAKTAEGDLVESIPEGYEIYENSDAQVFLRKIVPQLVIPAEVAVVEEGLKRYAPGQNCLVDVQ